jgi:predicted DNA-binding ribbon-helix-helix protein
MSNATSITNVKSGYKATRVDVHQDRWRRFKSLAALRGMTVKQLLDQILSSFLDAERAQ